MRDVQVSAVANGWIVTVGCQKFVYDEVAKLAADFQSYLTDPEGTEKRIMATAVNAKHTMNAPNVIPERGYVGGQGGCADVLCEPTQSYVYDVAQTRR